MANSRTYLLPDDGIFPNNAELPLLVYSAVSGSHTNDLPAVLETQFSRHGWPAAWRGGIFGVHHYHSTAHEVLGIYAGEAEIQFGGETGPVLTVGRGDVVVIPAGVAHKSCRASGDFATVGAYPAGQHPDACYGKPGERPGADNNIASVALPAADPVRGDDGPLLAHWRRMSIS